MLGVHCPLVFSSIMLLGLFSWISSRAGWVSVCGCGSVSCSSVVSVWVSWVSVCWVVGFCSWVVGFCSWVLVVVVLVWVGCCGVVSVSVSVVSRVSVFSVVFMVFGLGFVVGLGCLCVVVLIRCCLFGYCCCSCFSVLMVCW